jgi:DNA repair protein RadC
MGMKITCPQQAATYLRRVMRRDVEEFWALAFDSDRNLLAADCLFRGTVDSCFFHPRDLFRFACRNNASSLLIAHNHPSQNPLPSDEDRTITNTINKASKILSIPLVDHLIITDQEIFSFLEHGMMPKGRWS